MKKLNQQDSWQSPISAPCQKATLGDTVATRGWATNAHHFLASALARGSILPGFHHCSEDTHEPDTP